MLPSKQLIVERLAALKAYSIAADGERDNPQPEKIKALFVPVETTVNTYFSSRQDVSALLNETIEFMYFDLARRTVRHEHEFDMNLRSDYPVGYLDVTKCFFQFDSILGVDDAAFYGAFVYGVPALDEGSGGDSSGNSSVDAESGDEAAQPVEVPLSNPYLDAWPPEVLAALQTDVANLTALDEWCQDAGNADLISLFEEQGKTLVNLGVRDGGAEIYLNRNVLTVIEGYPLTSYIPSWLEGFYLDSNGNLAVGRISRAETFELDDNGDARLCVPATASTYFAVDDAGDIMAREVV